MTDSEQQQATTTSSQQQHVQATPDPPAGTSSSAHVYLSNLPVEAYEGTIKHAFEQQGIQVEAVELLKKGSFNRRHNSGLATVRLALAADVERSCALLDGKQLQAGADAASARPMIVRRDKFECCQPGYSPQQPEQHEAGSSADPDSS